MSDATEATTEETLVTETTETKTMGSEHKDKPKGEMPRTADKSSPDSLYKEKIDSLHSDLSKVRSEKKSIQQERDDLKMRVAAFELKEKKSEALSKAISGIGEDFEIVSDKMPVLNKLVDKIQDDEDLDETVKSLVEAMTSPKAKPRRADTPWSGPAQKHNNKTEITSLDEAPSIDWSNQK